MKHDLVEMRAIYDACASALTLELEHESLGRMQSRASYLSEDTLFGEMRNPSSSHQASTLEGLARDQVLLDEDDLMIFRQLSGGFRACWTSSDYDYLCSHEAEKRWSLFQVVSQARSTTFVLYGDWHIGTSCVTPDREPRKNIR